MNALLTALVVLAWGAVGLFLFVPLIVLVSGFFLWLLQEKDVL